MTEFKIPSEGAVLNVSAAKQAKDAVRDHNTERLEQWKARLAEHKAGRVFRSPYTDLEHHENTVYLIIKRFQAKLDLLYNLRK